MNPASYFLPDSLNDWLSARSNDSWASMGCPQTGWILSGAVVLVMFLSLVDKRIHFAGINLARAWVIMCLLLTSLGQFGCVRVETVDKVAEARLPADPGCGRPDCVSEMAMRKQKGTIPSAAPQGLPVPAFSLQAGTVAFGTKIKLSVSMLPVGAVIEYSYDNGKTWIPGDQAAVLGTDPILARTRINDLTSNPSQATFTPYYQRMMVIGNSIMSHAPQPSTGWFNNNGMAASAPEKDFVHLLTAHLVQQHPQLTVRLVSSGNFERQFGQSYYSIDEFNEPLRQFKPDLIIVRLGENVEESEVLSRNFDTQFRLLLERLATYGGQPARLICTTSFWRRPKADVVIRRVAAEKNLSLVDLSGMVGQDQYLSYNQYRDAGVGAHPNDTGMRRIADLIREKLPLP